MPDPFEQQNYSPMLIGHEVEPFDDENYIFELKLDGIRTLLYLDEQQTIIKNKRNKDVTDLYPELKNIHLNTKKRCVLDGEIVVFKNGKPCFSDIQKRSLMTDPIKIMFVMKNIPVEVDVFDILYYDQKELFNLPLMERKKILTEKIKEGHGLSISRYVEKDGIAFYNLVMYNQLEGIVGKRKDSLYFEGIRTKDWKKIKYMKDEDVIICGYEEEEGIVKSYILASYDKHHLLYRGKVSLGISNEEKKMVQKFEQTHQRSPLFSLNSTNIHWIKPLLVGTVHYMELTKNNHFRQPVWKGIRTDKDPKECIL